MKLASTEPTRRQLLKSLAGAAVGISGSWLSGCEPRHREVNRWGSSTLGSSGYVIMEAFAQAANRGTTTRNSSLATSGAAENLALIANGALEFAHSTSVDWTVAAKGERPYQFPIVCQQMFAYATWHMPPVVRRDSGIATLADLRGRRYAPSTPGSGASLMHHCLMRAAGLEEEIRWTYGSWNEIYDAFKTKRVDVVPGVITNDAVSARLMEARAAVDVVPLSIPEEVMTRVQAINSGIYSAFASTAEWSGIEEPILLPFSIGILAAARETSAEVGYQVTKSIFDDAEKIRSLGLALRYVDLDFALRGLMPEFPVNAGALQYFRERGIVNDALSILGGAAGS